jgi:hypothetical protein
MKTLLSGRNHKVCNAWVRTYSTAYRRTKKLSPKQAGPASRNLKRFLIMLFGNPLETFREFTRKNTRGGGELPEDLSKKLIAGQDIEKTQYISLKKWFQCITSLV